MSVEPREDAKGVNFSYWVDLVRPVFISCTPSAALSTGGSKVLLEVGFFEYDSPVFVRFGGGDPLSDNSVEILPNSNRLTSWIRFVTPESSNGQQDVAIWPKTCPEPCETAVIFAFLQIDPTQPDPTS